MSTPQFIDYQAIKREVGIIQILEHYDLMSRLRQNGDSITGTCPIHETNNTVAFRASVSGNCWNCFNQCGCGGDILDFVSRKEKVSLHKAARLIIKWFNLSFDPPITEAIKPKASFQSAAGATTSHISDSPACGNQTVFAVKRYWSVCDSVNVKANSVFEAIGIAHELPVDNAQAEFVPDSMNSDPLCDVQPLLDPPKR
jgi:hypothetical protein